MLNMCEMAKDTAIVTIVLVLPASNIFTKFRRGQPYGGAKYRWGIKISRFSTNKLLYLVNDKDIAIVTMEGE